MEDNYFVIKLEEYVNPMQLKEYYKRLDPNELKFIITNPNNRTILLKTVRTKDRIESAMGVKVLMWLNTESYLKCCSSDGGIDLLCNLFDEL